MYHKDLSRVQSKRDGVQGGAEEKEGKESTRLKVNEEGREGKEGEGRRRGGRRERGEGEKRGDERREG